MPGGALNGKTTLLVFTLLVQADIKLLFFDLPLQLERREDLYIHCFCLAGLFQHYLCVLLSVKQEM